MDDVVSAPPPLDPHTDARRTPSPPPSSTVRTLRRLTPGVLRSTSAAAVVAYLASITITGAFSMLPYLGRPLPRSTVDQMLLIAPRVLPADVLTIGTLALLLTYRQTRRPGARPHRLGLLFSTTAMAAPAWALVGLAWQAHRPVSPVEIAWSAAVLTQWAWLLARTMLDPSWHGRGDGALDATPSPSPLSAP